MLAGQIGEESRLECLGGDSQRTRHARKCPVPRARGARGFKEHESAGLARWHRGVPRRAPKLCENPNRELLLPGRPFGREGLLQAGVELSLGSSDEAFTLVEESPQPRVIRLAEEAGYHRVPDEPIAEWSVERQVLGAFARPG